MSLDSDDLAALVGAALGRSASAGWELVETISGAINDVYRIRVGQTDYALRVRWRETDFRYERNLLKEAVAAAYLAAKTTSGASDQNEKALDQSLEQLGQQSLPDPVGMLPRLVFLDTSRTIIPVPWLLQEWVPGILVAHGVSQHYKRTGTALARLHERGFSRFRTSFHSPWQDRKHWLEAMKTEGQVLSVELGIAIPWDGLLSGIGPETLEFCLNHNDLQPFNIIASGDRILFIDWDNLQIGPPEFDLVKLKHWTDCCEDGFFRQNAAKFELFRSAYQEACRRQVSEAVFRLCETVWLLRVTSFETKRAANGHRPIRPFRGPEHYRDQLKFLIEGYST